MSGLKYLKGVGPAREKLLARLGLVSVEDLLQWYPREYQSRPRVRVNSLPRLQGQLVQIQGRLTGPPVMRRVRSGLQLINAALEDESGFCQCTWFNQAYLKKQLAAGQRVTLVGKYTHSYQSFVVEETHAGLVQLPETQPLHNLTAGITQVAMNRIVATALKQSAHDPFPPEFREKNDLAELGWAYQEIHFPSSPENLERARYRLKFQELFFHHLAASHRRRERSLGSAVVLTTPRDLEACLARVVGFSFTDAQRRVIAEIAADLSRGTPMQRLIQGDVGSGKTVVAIFALLIAALNGKKGVLMAPTEILARQHYQVITTVAGALGVPTVLVTAGLRTAERNLVLEKLAAPGPLIAIGTHALFQTQVDIHDLVLAVTDEQHRFGVRQRLALATKGSNSHILVMSATPIPRTLAMSVYGDLDVSTIDEKPAGRQEVKTYVAGPEKRERIFKFICKEMAAGNKGYIVCPLIEESESVAAQSLAEYRQILARNMPAWVRIGELHGRMGGEEKAAVVAALKGGEYHALLSTTVVEVGVDIGKATFMIVENAERYGLAQLHQLRGRVGRNDQPGWCFLISEGNNSQRLKIMEIENDGFAIAKADLLIRGPGQMFGNRQHGINEFKIANFINDGEINEKAWRLAQVCSSHPMQWPELLEISRKRSDMARG